MIETTNLKLEKSELTESYSLSQHNDNLDKIDTVLGSHTAEMASKHITESGTNENGSYIKFDDGTMVVYGEFDGGLGSSEIPSLEVPLPAPFASIQQARKAVGSVSGVFVLEGGILQAYGALSEYMVFAQSNTTWRISAKTVAPVASTRRMRINAMLIGRWK